MPRWKPAGPVETPGLVLMRAGTGPGAAPLPVIQRVTTAEQVIAQVPFRATAGGKPQVVFEVLREAGGAAVSERTARIGVASGGTSVAEAIVPAASLPPGRYTLRATIRPGNATPLYAIVRGRGRAPLAAGLALFVVFRVGRHGRRVQMAGARVPIRDALNLSRGGPI